MSKKLEVRKYYVAAGTAVGKAVTADVVEASEQLLEFTDTDFADATTAWESIQAANAELARCGYVGRQIESLSTKGKSVKARSIAGVINSGLSLVVFNYMSPARTAGGNGGKEVWIANALQEYAAGGNDVAKLLAKHGYNTAEAAAEVAATPYTPASTNTFRVLQKDEITSLGLE